ncbi:MAG: hypothetical protein LUG44_11865, partial [Clostridiales bacterium]|nr:hypothetical protein [Clostridiales bacterium]
VEWLQAAEAVGWCLAKHTESIFTEAGADPDVEDAKYLLRRLTFKGEHEISKGELVRRCQKRFPRADDMNRALHILEERNYIRVERIETGKKGRPPEIIKIHPAVLG